MCILWFNSVIKKTKPQLTQSRGIIPKIADILLSSAAYHIPCKKRVQPTGCTLFFTDLFFQKE